MNKSHFATLCLVSMVGASILLSWLIQSRAKPIKASDLKAITPKPSAKIGYPSLMSPHSSPIALHENRLFVTNTPADTVDVINTKTRKVVRRISVGIDPVSISVRPDGKEIWVANHISDSVSIIDNDRTSSTFLRVIATVQDFGPNTSTRFDEPVGIAFANNTKAYIALSSENKIAVIDVATRQIKKRLEITAQDPRAIAVRNGRLYVIPFESNNKTQLSGGYKIDGELVTFNAHEHSIANNNVLSLGHVTDIIKHPRVPDRDLYIFDTKTDKLIRTVDTLGTLLYGLAVDSKGTVFIAQTDARNDINGRAGTKKHSLKELENRAFLNQITKVRLGGNGSEKPRFINLEPLPPKHPEPGQSLATPFAIQISNDDSTLVVTAAGSDKVFTVDTKSGNVMGRVKVESTPRGIALETSSTGKLSQAWILNAVANSVSLVDVSDPHNLSVKEKITLEDPTHPIFKRGRIAFNKASASTTETFSCASCHPDGHTDQLLWVLKTPIVTGGNQIMPRSTMPLRGLRDTAPFHWDGIPGDPYGGNNSAHIRSRVKPNSKINEPESTTRHVVDGSLASTMKMVGDNEKNDEGKDGLLSKTERDDMAKFLLNITYPPAQRRAYTNVLSEQAEKGFELFHIKGDVGGTPGGNLCGNCHRMPFWVSTNTPGTGMDAPTWRGAYDRFLILPQGRLNIIDFDFYRRVAERGIPERNVWQFSWGGRRAFDPVWNMVLEGSTGFSGSFARQVTLNKNTANNQLTTNLLNALENSSNDGGIVLQVDGLFLNGKQPTATQLQYDGTFENGTYVEIQGERRSITREKLTSLASEGQFIGTFTGRHGENADYDHPQPAVWTLGPIHSQRGRQNFPVLYNEKKSMTVSGRHIRKGASLIVDGKRVPGSIRTEKTETIIIDLVNLPDAGIHFLQIQNPNGLFSNDFIFHVAENQDKAKSLQDSINPNRLSSALAEAIKRGDLQHTKKLIADGASLNARKNDGSTPLSTASFNGRLEIAEYLIQKGARVTQTNRDGNTPLHVAAFMCQTEIIKLFLEKGAPVRKKNNRGESAIDVVSSTWNEDLETFYRSLINSSEIDLTIEQIKLLRPQILKVLRNREAKSENGMMKKVITKGKISLNVYYQEDADIIFERSEDLEGVTHVGAWDNKGELIWNVSVGNRNLARIQYGKLPTVVENEKTSPSQVYPEIGVLPRNLIQGEEITLYFSFSSDSLLFKPSVKTEKWQIKVGESD
ncbi:MAG: ankyrin repeat domain-containing protein [Verrucomicrobiales bacterium]|nr:ankyrin repeat domain-containing protein [Verrucomicrobiales bacterium]